MDDPRIYLEKLSAFVRILRMEGLVIGTNETADACRVLIELGMDERELVKTALRTVFAKSHEEQAAFDRAFDAFFISSEELLHRKENQKQQGKGDHQPPEYGFEFEQGAVFYDACLGIVHQFTLNL